MIKRFLQGMIIRFLDFPIAENQGITGDEQSGKE
jgi:hypothetical protein